jgi:hypothetical protein
MANIPNVDGWLKRSLKLRETIKNNIDEFQSLSSNYADMRDAAANNNDAKEEIDESYKYLVKVKKEFCDLQAGGRRKGRKTRRSRRY